MAAPSGYEKEKEMKEKFGYLFRNMGLLFVSNFATKILSFLMVPLYTSVLTTKEYGIYDLLHTIMLMLIPVLSMGIVDAVMRFSIGAERQTQQKNLTVGLKYTFISISILFAGTILGAKVANFDTLQKYGTEFMLMYLAYSFYNLFTQFCRGIDDVKGVATASVICTVTTIAFNLLFLLKLELGLEGYFYAAILSLLIPDVYLFFHAKLYRYIQFNKDLLRLSDHERSMLIYCIPLIFINLSWYINNLSDRFVVSLFCGVAANGVYSVAYKIPSILNAVQTIFIQAWQLSAVREFSARDGEPFYRKTYQGCKVVMVMLCSSLIVGTRIAARILFANDFYAAWVYVPTLLIYIVFNTLSGTVGGIFSAVKDSKSLTVSAVTGSLVNIVLNFVLVYYMGAMGAAIATVISSVVIWVMRIAASRKHMVLKLKYWLHVVEFVILGIQAAAMTLITDLWGYLIQIALWIVLLVLNIYEVKMKDDDV